MRSALATMVLASTVEIGCLQISTTGFADGGTTTGGLLAGAPCGSNSACGSGVCGLKGTGSCCSTACSTTSLTCGAIGCDDGGACVYPPAGIDCASAFCNGHSKVQPQCDGLGGCSAQGLAACPSNLECNDAGTACYASCTSSVECVRGFSCNAGLCVVPEPVGSCTENDDCVSGYCGVNGSGYCCSAACSQSVPCGGATGCDPVRGACDYPNTGLVCGQVSCGGGVIQPAPTCELGSCQAGQPIDCAPFACNAAGCEASCSSDVQCAQGYCDVPASTCCSLPSGATINVDSAHGNDLTTCCGTPDNGACQTITHVMQRIDEAQASDVIIQAAIPSNGTWAPSGEIYPIILGWGAELRATGVTFYDGDGGNRSLFEIGPVSGNDRVGYSSIVGGWIGGRTPSARSTILVDPGSTLYLASALVASSVANETTAIEISAGGALVIGRDHPGEATGLVTIGPQPKDQGNLEFEGYKGIVCDSANGLSCTITDAPLDGGVSLFIVDQAYHDIDAEDFSTIRLASAPRIGAAAAGAPLLSNCPHKTYYGDGYASADGSAILLHGAATMLFSNGFVQCVNGAFYLEASDSGVPSLTLAGAVVQLNLTGVYASAGTATLSNTTIEYNDLGVWQDTDGTHAGTLDLSGGLAGGRNTVACNRSPDMFPSCSVLNTTATDLDATNVAWDTQGPDVFSCQGPNWSWSAGTCKCEASSYCTAGPGSNGMDAVYESTGTIHTAGNTVAAITCF